MTANTTLAIVNRAIERDDEPLSPEAARHILRWGFGHADQARVAELFDKLKADTITADERMELEEFNRANHLLTLMKSKARQAIRPAQQ